MSRQFGTRVPDTAAARNKARIGGGIIAVAVVINLIACIVGGAGGRHEIILPMLWIGGLLVLVGLVYMFLNRRAS